MRSDWLRGFTERKCNRAGSTQLLSGCVLGLELRRAKRRVGGLLGRAQQRGEHAHDAGASLGPHRFRGPEELRGQPRLPGAGGMTAQCVEGPVLRHAIVDLAGNLQRFGEQRLCRGKVAFCQSHHAQVDQHHLKAVEITDLATQTRALHRRGSDPVKIALEQTAERPSLEQHQHG